MATFHRLTVQSVDRETPDAVVVALEVPEALRDSFRFVPGQYLTFRVTIDGEEVRRSYSICAGPGETLRVGIKKVRGGRFSTFAHEHLAVNDTLDVMPPQGRFVVADQSASSEDGGLHHVAFAGGSGITPILSILTYVLETRPQDRFTLFYGNRRLASVMFLDRLHQEKDKHLHRLQLFHALTNESVDAPLFQGRLDGEKVTDFFRVGLLRPDDVDVAYVCGPGSMIDEVTGSLKASGLAEERIRTERFTAKKGAEGPAPVSTEASQETEASAVWVDVQIDGVRRQFPVTGGEAVIDAAARAGVDLPWSCRGGMCSTCRCRVLEGEVDMLQNYSLEPWELDRGFVLACQAVPKSDRLVLDFDEQ